MLSGSSFPRRLLRYALRLPGRLFNRLVCYPIVNRWIKGSRLQVYVHDEARGLLRPIGNAERLQWTLTSGLVNDAVPWMDRVEPLFGRDDVVFDVGACSAVVSHWFAARCSVVHAFEPHPENLATMARHIALSGTANIETHACAVGRKTGRQTLYVKDFSGHHSLGDHDINPTVGRIEVEVETVDRVCAELGLDRVNFLKIDVEGWEDEVIAGARRMLAEKRIDHLLFEFKNAFMRSLGRPARELFDRLSEAGYTIVDLEGRRLPESRYDAPDDGDYLATLDPEKVCACLTAYEGDVPLD